MFKKRYEIQVGYTQDGMTRVRKNRVEWKTFYNARTTFTLASARKELFRWKNHQWDFVSDTPDFRIFDRKTGKAVA